MIGSFILLAGFSSGMSRSHSSGRDRPSSFAYGLQDSGSSIDSRSTNSGPRNNSIIAEVRVLGLCALIAKSMHYM